jgi:hypothetical protein
MNTDIANGKKGTKLTFGIVSICAPFVGILLAIAVQYLDPDTHSGRMGIRDIFRLLGLISISLIIGFIAGWLALKRQERRSLAICGLLLNVSPLFYVLFNVIVRTVR